MINDARCASEFKYRIVTANPAFEEKKTLVLNSRLNLNLRKKRTKCCILSITFCGAESCYGEKVKNSWEVFKCGAGKRMYEIS